MVPILPMYKPLIMYFVSLTGFVASWIAGEVYTPQDKINKSNKEA